MNRRTFAQLAALSPALAGASKGVEVALITHANGPHLSAYIEGLAKTPEVGTVYLSDPSGSTAAAVRKGLGEKFGDSYKSPKDLFSAHKPPVAFITMEAVLAPPVVAAALDAGCHVMVEKPACVRLADFAPLVDKANSNKKMLMLALANRVDPVMMEARRIVQSGAIGKIYSMDLHAVADQTRLTTQAFQQSWTPQKARSGGGHLIWLGIHWLDLAMFISGSKITQVAGFTGNVGGQPIDTEDSAAISFRFANGTFGNLNSGYYIDRGKHLYIKIWGSQGWLEVNHGALKPLEWEITKGGKREMHQMLEPGGPAGYTPFVTHVVRAAMGTEQPILSPDESLHVLKTIFAAYRAAETGHTQKVTS